MPHSGLQQRSNVNELTTVDEFIPSYFGITLHDDKLLIIYETTTLICKLYK